MIAMVIAMILMVGVVQIYLSSKTTYKLGEAFGRIQEIVRAIRNARSEYDVEPARRIAASFSADRLARCALQRTRS